MSSTASARELGPTIAAGLGPHALAGLLANDLRDSISLPVMQRCPIVRGVVSFTCVEGCSNAARMFSVRDVSYSSLSQSSLS
jgi:hypothetical protein